MFSITLGDQQINFKSQDLALFFNQAGKGTLEGITQYDIQSILKDINSGLAGLDLEQIANLYEKNLEAVGLSLSALEDIKQALDKFNTSDVQEEDQDQLLRIKDLTDGEFEKFTKMQALVDQHKSAILSYVRLGQEEVAKAFGQAAEATNGQEFQQALKFCYIFDEDPSTILSEKLNISTDEAKELKQVADQFETLSKEFEDTAYSIMIINAGLDALQHDLGIEQRIVTSEIETGNLTINVSVPYLQIVDNV